MNELKILFAGTMGAGKTTAIAAVSDIAPISTDVANTDMSESAKLQTTVALDYGEVSLGDGQKLRLYGSPGQARFDFMWPILAADALGVIVLIDNSRPDPIADLARFLSAFRTSVAADRLVVGIGRMESHPLPNLGSYLDHLESVGQLIPVLPIDIRRRADVLLLLEALFRQLEYFGSEPAAPKTADWQQLVCNARESE